MITLPVEHRSRIVHLAAVGVVVGAVPYLAWRLLATGDGAFPPFFVVLLAIETLGITRLVTLALPWLPGRRQVAAAEPGPALDADIVVVAGTETPLQLRTTLWSCLHLTSTRRVVVVNALGRGAVEQECARLGVDHRAATGWASIESVLRHVVATTTAEALVLMPADCAALPDLISVTTPMLTGDVAGVTVPGTVVATPQSFGAAGYDLGLEADPGTAAQLAAAGAGAPLDGPLVARVDRLRALEGPGGGRRPWLAAGYELLEAGHRLVVAPATLALRQAPGSEVTALRERWRRVRGVRETLPVPPPSRLFGWHRVAAWYARLDAWSVLGRVAMIALVPLVTVTGRLPLTLGPVEVVLVVAPWLWLCAMSRRWLQPHRRGLLGQVRRDVRTLAVDLHALTVGRPHGRSGEPVEVGGPSPGRLRRFQRWTATGLVVAAVITGLPLVGMLGAGLSSFAEASVAVVGLALVWLARDTLWAGVDRQRRAVPRAPFTHMQPLGSFEVVDISPVGLMVRGPCALAEGQVIAIELALPVANREPEVRACTGVVKRVEPGSRAFVQLDVDEHLFDELLYFTAVTLPMLDRLWIRTRPVLRLTETGERREPQDPDPWLRGLQSSTRESELGLSWLRAYVGDGGTPAQDGSAATPR